MGIEKRKFNADFEPLETKRMKLAKKPFWVGNSSTEEKSSFEPTYLGVT
jgi:hypothetical protein